MAVGALGCGGDVVFGGWGGGFESLGDVGFEAVEACSDASDVGEDAAELGWGGGGEVDATEPADELRGVDDFHAYKCTKRGVTLCLG